MGALHQVYPNATYNGLTGSAEDELGWAIGAGVEFTFAGLGNGGSIALQGAYTDGASGYGSTGWNSRITDAVFNGSSTETTRTWNLFGGLNLGLTETLQTNIEGGYHSVDGGTSAYDFTQWDATANVVWQPVNGFIMGPEVQYREVSFNQASGLNDTNEIYAAFRLQRTF